MSELIEFQECEVIATRYLKPSINTELLITKEGKTKVDRFEFMEYIEKWCENNGIGMYEPKIDLWLKSMVEKYSIKEIKYYHDYVDNLIVFDVLK